MTATNGPHSSSNGPAHLARNARGSPGSPDGPFTDAGLDFVDVERLELDSLLQQLRDRADDVLGTQGRLRGLLRANAAVAADLSLPVVLHRVAEAARDLLQARHAAIGVIGRDGQLEHFVPVGTPVEIVPRGRGILGLPMTGPTPTRLTDHVSQSASAGFPTGSFLGVPVRVGEAVFGNLYVTERTDGGQFTAEDEQLVTALAVAAGGAIANARLFTESEQRRRWLVASGELTNQLLSADTEQPLTVITEQAATAAGADFATLALSLGDDQVIVAAVSGVLAADLAGRTAPVETSLCGHAIRTGKPALIADCRDESPAIAVSVEMGPLLVVPLTAGEHTRGALTLGRLANRAGFTETDLNMAASFATQAAVALELHDARDAHERLARADDRDRIAGDLHDHVIQELFALGMGLQGLASVTDRPAHVSRIVGYIDSLDKVISTIRGTIFQMQQPTGHDPTGLRTRILDIATEHTPQLGFTPQLRFAGPLDLAVNEGLAADVLAVIREAISNCARHASATRLEISIALAHDLLTLEITDNGHGLGTPIRSSGLTNMHRRAEHHHGTLAITTPDQGGTHLTWTGNLPTLT
jgi:two-component system, NarL family, sensor histidine kinase DevS